MIYIVHMPIVCFEQGCLQNLIVRQNDLKPNPPIMAINVDTTGTIDHNIYLQNSMIG